MVATRGSKGVGGEEWFGRENVLENYVVVLERITEGREGGREGWGWGVGGVNLSLR
jgi:hypothetical protein